MLSHLSHATRVLLAMVAMVWGQECDVTSHLTTKARVTKVAATQASAMVSPALLSEFRPNPPGADPAILRVEISGTPNVQFPSCLFTVDADPPGELGRVDSVIAVSGSFDANGLLVVDIPDFENPSFTLFMSAACPDVGQNVITDAAVVAGRIAFVYDSIGVPDSTPDEANVAAIRAALAGTGIPGGVPGTDLTFVGDAMEEFDPDLVFRDASVGEVYQVVTEGTGPIFTADATELDQSDFNFGPFDSTFQAINPTRVSEEEEEPGEDPGVIGDPHVHTFKGDHYTLLREGSFLLWHFGLKQPDVEWQIFAHYSGRQSFAKGLLLVDTSGPQPSKMEITAEKCHWQTNGVKGNPTEWLSTNKGALLPTGPSSHLKLVDVNDDMKKVQFFLAGEKAPVATLKVLCRQGRHINVKLHMANQKWKRFVSGQLKGTSQSQSSKKTSMLQLAVKEDQEFEMKKTWEELGGSPHGQQYLESFDHSQNLGLIQTCVGQAEAEARAICRKHLGDLEGKDSAYFQECVFDVCAGAGEAGAEMAAEILKS
eukprot:Skav206724  [mRNA]  locus=scaffold967:227717:229336:- [translate_table: standard]